LRDTVVYSILAGEWPGLAQRLERMLSAHDGKECAA
jgi:hypothetical protein